MRLLNSFKCSICGCVSNYADGILPVDDNCPWCKKAGLVRQVVGKDGKITEYTKESK